MKNIFINNPKMTRSDSLIKFFNSRLSPQYQDSVIDYKGCEVFSDFTSEVSKSGKDKDFFESLSSYFQFVLDYAYNIFVNNNMVLERKEPPYEAKIQCFLDVAGKQGKLYFYFDGDIFGLLVGSSHVNIGNLIKTSFPIFSKLGMEIEIKVFSTKAKEKERVLNVF